MIIISVKWRATVPNSRRATLFSAPRRSFDLLKFFAYSESSFRTNLDIMNFAYSALCDVPTPTVHKYLLTAGARKIRSVQKRDFLILNFDENHGMNLFISTHEASSADRAPISVHEKINKIC